MVSITSSPCLSIDLKQVGSMVDLLPFATHMYSLRSQEYVLANRQYAKQLGFHHQEEVIPSTYSRITGHRRQCIMALGGNLALEDAYQQFIQRANLQTEAVKKPHRFQVCKLSATGFVYTEIVQKLPIFDKHEVVNAILTLSQDITARFDLLDIYQLYKKHYIHTKQAIRQFLVYLGVESVFRVLPTDRELLTLLVFKKDIRAKYVARQLALSNRTVEEYKARLRSKLKVNTTLEKLLLKLRDPVKDSSHPVLYDDIAC